MTTNITALPVWLSVFFTEQDDECSAMLRISANNDPALTITISHEDSETFAISGNAEIKDLLVADGDSLLIAAYNKDGDVVAGGLYGVSLDLIRSLSAVLTPIYESMMLVDQASQKLIDRAAARALDAICGASTGDLVVAEVAR